MTFREGNTVFLWDGQPRSAIEVYVLGSTEDTDLKEPTDVIEVVSLDFEAGPQAALLLFKTVCELYLESNRTSNQAAFDAFRKGSR
jgi:hypothetical protein